MATGGARPNVVIAGAGLAGLAAAHRLLERGCDVTLIEANDFLGGKLGAHRDTRAEQRSCDECRSQGGCLARTDWHEHCYHMYLNWYHNFWELMDEIGSIGHFVEAPAIYNLHPAHSDGRAPPPIAIVNMGSPWTMLHNLFSGYAPPLDMLLYAQASLDLLAEPAHRHDLLERTSVTAFMEAHSYATKDALQGTYRTTAQAFASPSYLSSARSFRSLLSYGARLPEPSMWLLDRSTEEAIFAPWLQHLDAMRAHGGGTLTRMMLTSITGLEIDKDSRRVIALRYKRNDGSPTIHDGNSAASPTAERMPVHGPLILALPLTQLGGLVTPEIAAIAPRLPNVRYLRTEPMISMDLVFRRQLEGVPKDGITVLLDSPYEMSFLDTSRLWKRTDTTGTVLNVIASNADTLTYADETLRPGYTEEVLVDLLLDELARYVGFDRKADLMECRTHLQTNLGQELFVNQVGSWQWRPETTCEIPNLAIAGDYCKTFIDVVTVEGAVVSGLMAAEAVRRRLGLGAPIAIRRPDQYPVSALAAAAAMTRPFAALGWLASRAEAAMTDAYRRLFPNG